MDRSKTQRDGDSVQLYSVLLCEVSRLQPYGAFVKMPGSRSSGLIHKSQMSKSHVEEPEEVVAVGDNVYVKVISIDDEGKIGLSMKFINQTTGKDEDSNHVQATLDQQRRQSAPNRDTPRIQLEAVLDTTCRKCGGKGHLVIDCFHVPGSKTYELLTEDAEPSTAAETPTKEKSHKHSHHKKHKKEKKSKKKRDRHDSRHESDEDETGSKSKRHKKKHRHC